MTELGGCQTENKEINTKKLQNEEESFQEVFFVNSCSHGNLSYKHDYLRKDVRHLGGWAFVNSV